MRVDPAEAVVGLRPLEPADVDLLLAAGDDGDVPPFGGTYEERRQRIVRRIERSGQLVEGRLDYGIEAEGRLVGAVEARQPREGLPPGVYEIGIALFDTADRGRGIGTRAVEVFVRRLFDDGDTHRVQATTWVENDAMRRVLEKLGFIREGVMRNFMPAGDGVRHDYAMYGTTRAEWEAREAREAREAP